MEKDSNAGQKETYFAPAGRAERQEIERQAEEVLKNPIVEKFLKSIQGYLLVLNAQRQILTANKEFVAALGDEDPDWLLGLRPGESLNCRNVAEGPDGCGTAPKCKSCGAVLAILACQNNNASSASECCIEIRRGETIEKKHFKVNASPVGDETGAVMLFSVLDVSAAKQLELLEEIFLHDILNTLGNVEAIGELQENDPSAEIKSRMIVRRLKEEIYYHRSLMEAQKGTLQKRGMWVSIGDAVSELRDILACHSQLGLRRIHFDVNPDRRIYTDKALLIRVLLNMALNAIEASSNNDVVTIRYEDDGEHGVFSVHNIGVIPESVAAGIFSGSFSTKGGQGHGLGMYSMKLLGEQYLGGEVSFTTSAAEGTVFRIRLPLSQPGGLPEETSIAAAPLTKDVSSQQALLIDDMEQITVIEKLFLERAGFMVTAETDAEKALVLFKQNPRRFSVVITDMTMPKMSGLDVACEMHALNPQLPIILCTGHGDAVLDGTLRDTGIISVLQKPVARDELVKAIREIVGAG